MQLTKNLFLKKMLNFLCKFLELSFEVLLVLVSRKSQFDLGNKDMILQTFTGDYK